MREQGGAVHVALCRLFGRATIGHSRADRSDHTDSPSRPKKVRFAVGREVGTSPGKLVLDQRKAPVFNSIPWCHGQEYEF